MGRSIRIGRLFGIEIGIDYSWFIIFFFLVFALSLSYFPLSFHLSLATCWILGIITTILFFASIVAHELAHSIVSQRNGIPVKSITLFIFGGVARITKEVPRPGVEFRVAIAGPLCSLGLGVIFGIIAFLTKGVWIPIYAMTYYLALINVLLALFNMIPGFPLDGGRVFRSLIWSITGSYGRATRIACISGRVVAYLFMIGGIVAMFMLSGFWFNGLWFIFIGFILDSAARGSYRQARLRLALEPFTAEEMMSRDFLSVPLGLSLKELAENYFLRSGHRYFLVTEGPKLEGVVSLSAVEKVPQERREVTTVAQVMTPADKLSSVSPNDNGITVLERMEEQGIGLIPVVWEGMVVGVIGREELRHFIRIRTDYR